MIKLVDDASEYIIKLDNCPFIKIITTIIINMMIIITIIIIIINSVLNLQPAVRVATMPSTSVDVVSNVQRFINYYHHHHHLLFQMCKGSSIINVIITIIIIMSKSGRATDLWRSFCYFWKMCRWTPMPKNMP